MSQPLDHLWRYIRSHAGWTWDWNRFTYAAYTHYVHSPAPLSLYAYNVIKYELLIAEWTREEKHLELMYNWQRS